ncbi:MAG: DUF1361 domain-containing protein [Thermoleophilia bacterium]|nr:DUF1361 domain-containing protein [Thermoleophilia bacterium]
MDVLEAAVKNLSWMTGNLFLAWAPVLFAMHLDPNDARRRLAARVLVPAAPLLLAVRLGVRGDLLDAPVRAVVAVVLVGLAAWGWSRAARAGSRIARVVGIVGVVAFAPNAPYVLTDLFHFIQDVRLGDATLGAAITFSVQYAVFLTLGVAAWIMLVLLGRAWLQRHDREHWYLRALVPVCGVFAFGIYLGRIERFPLVAPAR